MGVSGFRGLLGVTVSGFRLYGFTGLGFQVSGF